MNKLFVVMFDGDIEADVPGKIIIFDTLREALDWLADQINSGEIYPDVEDDLIVIYEYNKDRKTSKPVWAFCGWHYSLGELGLSEQGKLPGHEASLYSEAFYECFQSDY